MSVDYTRPESASATAVRPLLVATDPAASLTISTSTAAISSVPAGLYAIALDKTGGVCYVTQGATCSVPASGSAPAAGTVPVRDGDEIVVSTLTSLAFILSGSGFTGTVAIVQLAAG